MIKYYCDICEKELKSSEEHFVYNLPQRVPCKNVLNEYMGTILITEDKELFICPSCRYEIAYALEKIKSKMLKEEP